MTTIARPRASGVPWWAAWLGFVLLCNAVGFASSLTGSTGIYKELVRPAWSPPGWVFGPVWTALYIAMGTATYLVWSRSEGRARTTALAVFAVQLALNFAWTPVFFGLQRIGLAAIVIVAVWLSVLAMTVVYYRRDRLAGVLVVPLLGWVSFATALNIAIWWLNR